MFFLKGLYGRKILATIGRDPNDQMPPIAFVIMKGETRYSWTWFLELLIGDLGGRSEFLSYIFVLDQQNAC